MTAPVTDPAPSWRNAVADIEKLVEQVATEFLGDRPVVWALSDAHRVVTLAYTAGRRAGLEEATRVAREHALPQALIGLAGSPECEYAARVADSIAAAISARAAAVRAAGTEGS